MHKINGPPALEGVHVMRAGTRESPKQGTSGRVQRSESPKQGTSGRVPGIIYKNRHTITQIRGTITRTIAILLHKSAILLHKGGKNAI